MTMKLLTKDGKLTAYAFACGYVEKRGFVTLCREYGAYLCKRHPSHPAGHTIVACRTINEGRTTARKLAV